MQGFKEENRVWIFGKVKTIWRLDQNGKCSMEKALNVDAVSAPCIKMRVKSDSDFYKLPKDSGAKW